MFQKTSHRILAAAFVVILAAGFLLSGNAAADVIQPAATAFTYQGQLSDGGNPAIGLYDFRFVLFDALSDGSPIGGAIALEDVQVNKGLFTVKLDFGPTAFNGSPRFLEVEVRPGASTGGYTVLSPRQELTPAPYAIFAGSAALAGTATLAGSAPWSGLTGIPAGFADGIDNDTITTYTNGTGLNLSTNVFSLNTTFTDNRYWKRMGNGGPNVIPAPGELYNDQLIVAWAKVTASGTLFGDFNFGISAVDHNLGVGVYHIELDKSFADAGFIIPVVNPEVDAVSDVPPTGAENFRFAVVDQVGELGVTSNTFNVYIYDGNFNLVDNDFTVIVAGRGN